MAATRASGTNAVRYGTMRENVLGLTVVTADGAIVRTGSRARKSVGRLRPHPALRRLRGHARHHHRGAAAALRHPRGDRRGGLPVRDLDGAVDTVIATIQSGVPIARVEILDDVQMQAINAYSKLDYPEAADALLRVPRLGRRGRGAGADGRRARRRLGGGAFQLGDAGTEDRNRLWTARHDVFWAHEGAAARRRGLGHRRLRADLAARRVHPRRRGGRDAAGLVAPIVGHVGDGNFHMIFVLDPDDPAEHAARRGVNARLVERAIAMGGTCTGEHGIGCGKMR